MKLFGVVAMAETGKRKCYDFRFKEAAVKYAEKTTNHAKLSKRKRNFGGGKKPVLADLEEELLQRIIDDRDRHLHVPCKLITAWALDIAE